MACFHTQAAGVVSDGSAGAFDPVGDVTLDMNALAPNGVFHFTTIHIRSNITVRFTANASNTPVFLAATGNISIEGTIDISGRDYFYGTPGPGGGAGGTNGFGYQAGENGQGPGAGYGGPLSTNCGYALSCLGCNGGGAGHATPGAIATCDRGGNCPAMGGPSVPRAILLPGVSGGGGSGGGGGNGIYTWEVPVAGGQGGGGGGALQLATPGHLSITGRILANGAHAGSAYANGLNFFAGTGGGGAGGNVELYAGTLSLGSGALVEVRGGAGGGFADQPVSLDPFLYSCGANGGAGYAYVCASDLTVAPGATVNAVVRGCPVLRADYVGGAVEVSWPAIFSSFQLQQNVNLSTTNWTPVTNAVQVIAERRRVFFPSPTDFRCFRLIQQ